jgi:hypothetical protein
VNVDSRALDAAASYRFRIRLALGTSAPVAPFPTTANLVAEIRSASAGLAARAEAVATALEGLGARDWRPLNEAPSGREVLATHGFAVLEGSTLPEAAILAKEATAADVARDLAEAGGELSDELEQSLAVRVQGLDIPARLGPGPAELCYSPREFMETFGVRG